MCSTTSNQETATAKHVPVTAYMVAERKTENLTQHAIIMKGGERMKKCIWNYDKYPAKSVKYVCVLEHEGVCWLSDLSFSVRHKKFNALDYCETCDTSIDVVAWCEYDDLFTVTGFDVENLKQERRL